MNFNAQNTNHLIHIRNPTGQPVNRFPFTHFPLPDPIAESLSQDCNSERRCENSAISPDRQWTVGFHRGDLLDFLWIRPGTIAALQTND
jgi:hypothetical protein